MTRYECDHCGACCQGHLIVEAEALDVLREPRLIQAEPRYAGKSYDDVVDDLANNEKIILLAATRPCAFLSAEKLCTIYPTRPNCCVAMEAGDEQCQSARTDAGLPPLPALGEE